MSIETPKDSPCLSIVLICTLFWEGLLYSTDWCLRYGRKTPNRAIHVPERRMTVLRFVYGTDLSCWFRKGCVRLTEGAGEDCSKWFWDFSPRDVWGTTFVAFLEMPACERLARIFPRRGGGLRFSDFLRKGVVSYPPFRMPRCERPLFEVHGLCNPKTKVLTAP
jgi:hypothetical protein